MKDKSIHKRKLEQQLLGANSYNEIKEIIFLMISTGIHPRKYVDTTIYRKLILEKKSIITLKI